MSPDGRRAYAGRFISDDQARENLAVLEVDPDTGTVLARRLFRDSDRPLPASYTTPKAARPRSTVRAIVVGTRYDKLYLAATARRRSRAWRLPAARPTTLGPVITRHAAGDGVAYSYAFYPAGSIGARRRTRCSSRGRRPSTPTGCRATGARPTGCWRRCRHGWRTRRAASSSATRRSRRAGWTRTPAPPSCC
jgi:hypothetical protein